MLTDGTNYVDVSIRVTKYFGVAACTLTFRTYMVRRNGAEGAAVEE